jgi:hypothetical protein
MAGSACRASPASRRIRVHRVLRARGEVALAVLALVLAAVTAVWPTWIESLFEVSPDAGTGETEWWLVAVFLAMAVAAAVLARRDLRAARAEGA